MAAPGKHTHPLQRNGTTQSERYQAALDPTSVQLDDRDTQAMLDYAFRLAGELHFFDNQNEVDGNWESFLAATQQAGFNWMPAERDLPPHLTLFVAFLRLMKFPQTLLNDLPRRHLDFYYQEVLKINPKASIPDRVHLILELAKQVQKTHLPAGTLFKAGKDEAGQAIYFQTITDSFLNRAQVADIRSIRRSGHTFHAAPVANSADGLGEDFSDQPVWSGFGSTEQPEAVMGFALAAPVLLLQEGNRNIHIHCSLSGTGLDRLNLRQLSASLNRAIHVFASGEKEWLGPFSPTTTRVNRRGPLLLLEIEVSIGKDQEAILPYDPEALGGHFTTTDPLIQVMLDGSGMGAAFNTISQSILQSIRVEVDVKGVKGLQLENDLGVLDASKPFLPFGPSPTKRANFYIGSQEVFTKKLRSFEVKMRWKDLPESNSFRRHYSGYGMNIRDNSAFSGTLQVLSGRHWGFDQSFPLFNTDLRDTERSVQINFDGTQRLGQRRRRVRVAQARPMRAVARRVNEQVRRVEAQVNEVRRIVGQPLQVQEKEGFIKISLNRHFGHRIYPTKYSLAVADQVKTPKVNTPIPQAPYTPQIESVEIDYRASTGQIELSDHASARHLKLVYQQRELQFFHLTPFGEFETHPYLKKANRAASGSNVYLLPAPAHSGTLLIGLQDAREQESIRLLFQLVEGSANPERDPPELQWSLLRQNCWVPLTEDHILADHTNNLLTSGIIQFSLPFVDTVHQRLPDGLCWLRCQIIGPVDAAAKFVSITAQAVAAVRIASPDAPATPLAADTISKLKTPLAQIKKIHQPYTSFGGRPLELSDHYYRRVSERLRHKDRAISTWDYEHLVLEEFPDVHQVKCISHSDDSEVLRPGSVCLIVVPKVDFELAERPLQARVSAIKLQRIREYLAGRIGLFVDLHVQNPEYEEVAIQLKVRFHDMNEFGFYRDQLNEDLRQFLTPWVVSDGQQLFQFGSRLHKSQLITFLDQQAYVDFITDLHWFHTIGSNQQLSDEIALQASNPRAVLVSAPRHTISPLNDPDKC